MRRPWLLGLLVACSKVASGGLEDGGRPLDAGGGARDGGEGDALAKDGDVIDAGDDTEALVSAWAAAECSYLLRCQELSWAFLTLDQPGWDLAACEATFTAMRRASLAWYRARAAEGLIHDPVPRAEACRHALGAECGVDPREEGRTCDFWQDGRRANGAPCFYGPKAGSARPHRRTSSAAAVPLACRTAKSACSSRVKAAPAARSSATVAAQSAVPGSASLDRPSISHALTSSAKRLWSVRRTSTSSSVARPPLERVPPVRVPATRAAPGRGRLSAGMVNANGIS